MNTALILLDDFKIPSQLNSYKLFYSTQSDPQKKFADLALQLDEYIYIEHNNIDLVFVITDPIADVDIPTIISSNTIYFVNTIHAGSFICSPHIFSMLGNLYKFNYIQHGRHSFDEELRVKKMFYLIDRLGIDIHVL
jgi:hypothetical protein